MKVRFAFSDWRRAGVSIYDTEEGLDLSMGGLHSGTVFRGEIEMNSDDAEDFRRALESGAHPVFKVFAAEEEP